MRRNVLSTRRDDDVLKATCDLKPAEVVDHANIASVEISLRVEGRLALVLAL